MEFILRLQQRGSAAATRGVIEVKANYASGIYQMYAQIHEALETEPGVDAVWGAVTDLCVWRFAQITRGADGAGHCIRASQAYVLSTTPETFTSLAETAPTVVKFLLQVLR